MSLIRLVNTAKTPSKLTVNITLQKTNPVSIMALNFAGSARALTLKLPALLP